MLNYINLSLKTKLQTQSVKASVTIPNLRDIFYLLYIGFTIYIVPCFYINLYILATVTDCNIHDVSLYIIFISALFSCSTFYLLFVL